MKFEIKNRWNGSVLFTAELDARFETQPFGVRLGAAAKLATEAGVNLAGAYLAGAYLADAYIAGANLEGADLAGAFLAGANIEGANLARASLEDADLEGASLADADLEDADLAGANLAGADLEGANLARASLANTNLEGADLSEADLTPIRDDIWAVLSAAPAEVEGLRQALIEGRVNGWTYIGECACLVGTIANIRATNVYQLGALQPNMKRPAERFFLAIRKGDTPETNQCSMLALQWIDEWLFNMRAAFGPKEAA